MILPLEDRWGLLSVLEQEHGARQALRKLHADGDLVFEATQAPDQGNFLDTIAPLYVSQSLKQSKEFFRHAETSSWLVKPLLLYYAMLACGKACLVFAIPDFFKSTDARTHGISTDYAYRDQIEIATERIIVRAHGVYPLIRRTLGLKAFPPKTEIPLEELLVRLPDVDGWYRIFFGKGTSEEHWFTITGNVLAQSGGGVRAGFNLTPELYLKIEKRLPESIRAAFDINPYKASDGSERFGFLGKEVWPTEQAALSIGLPPVMSPKDNANCNVILPMEIGGVLYDISEIELMFLLMFYMSSLTRYQPHLWLQMHTGSEDFSALLAQTLMNAAENHFLRLVWARLSYTISLPFSHP